MKEERNCYRSGKFIQRRRTFYTVGDGSEKVLRIARTAQGKVFAGTDKGLYALCDGEFKPVFKDVFLEGAGALKALSDGRVVVSAGKKLYVTDGETIDLMCEFFFPVADVCECGSRLWVLTEKALAMIESDMSDNPRYFYLERGDAVALAANKENIYVATADEIWLLHGKRMEWKNLCPEFCNMPECSINDLSFDELGYLWIGADCGAVIFDNYSLWLGADQSELLPKNPVYRTVTDKEGGRYFATNTGLVIQKNGALKYLTAERWVPDNDLTDISVSPDGKEIYAACAKGVAKIEVYCSSLAEKAAAYEEQIEKYYIRRGFIGHRVYTDTFENGFVGVSDNDGLWTGCYVAAESLRYAVTGDEDALIKARRGMNAMLLLTRVTGIDGFTARAVRYEGDEGYGDGDNEWIKSEKYGCEWKCETSSDEMTGHFFGFSVYYDLCADEKEKEEIEVALCKIGDHIISNGYRLVDHDGLPTTWACWDPNLLNHSDRWYPERGINSLEWLAFLKVCHHLSGDVKYGRLYDDFVKKYSYPLNAMHHKIKDGHDCHIDDNLGFLASMTLLRLEDNKALRSILLCGMEDHWRYERVERQPLFGVIHAAFTGRDDDIAEWVQSLREMPEDLKYYRAENSKRIGLEFDSEHEEICGFPQLKAPLAYDERNIHRPDGSAFELDSNPRWRSSQEPTVYLLPYWAGRYFGVIDG